MFYSDLRELASDFTKGWWLYLVAGAGWLIVAVVVLKINLTSVTTVGILLGAIFLLTAIEEFVIASLRQGWNVLRVLLGVCFIGGAAWSFAHPYSAFWSLAAVLGVLLIVKGFFDVVYSAVAQAINPLWWLSMLTGVLQIAIGVWASTQWIASRALLLLFWVGFYAIFRGVSDIVLAFEIASTRHTASIA